MANSSPIFVAVPRNRSIKLSTNATDDNGSGSTLLFQAEATNGSRVHAISAVPVGSLSSAVVVRFFLEEGGTYWDIAEKTIPAYTETATVPAPATSFLEYGDMPFLDPADRYLTLGPNQALYVSLMAIPDASIHFTCFGGDY